MLGRVDRVGFGGVPGSTADLAHQPAFFPPCLALDVRRLVLDLLAVWRQPRGAAVARGDDDHRLGLNDRHVIRRRSEVSPRLLPTSAFVLVSGAATIGSAAPAVESAASMAVPTTAAISLPAAAARPILGDVTQFLVQGPCPDNRSCRLVLLCVEPAAPENDGPADEAPPSSSFCRV